MLEAVVIVDDFVMRFKSRRVLLNLSFVKEGLNGVTISDGSSRSGFLEAALVPSKLVTSYLDVPG